MSSHVGFRTSGLLMPGSLRCLAPVRVAPQRLAAPQQQQQHQRRLPVTTVARRSGSGRRGGGGGSRQATQLDPTRLLQQYGLPALGLLVAASLIGPLVTGVVGLALGLGATLAVGAAALSVSWVFVPLLVALFGMPALMAGGMAAGVFATAAVGTLLLPTLFQLVLVGGGLWLGATLAQQVFGGGSGGGSGGVGEDGVIDVEADTVDDDWRDEVFKERREREAELREFDDLLRRREEFKKGGPKY